VVILIILGAWWGSEPGQFNIQDEALKRAKETNTSDMPLAIPIPTRWLISLKSCYIKVAATLLMM